MSDRRHSKYIYDKAAAQHVIKFLEQRCRNVKGPAYGEPLKLLPWQKDFIEPLFGEKLPDGRRRYTYGFLWIPKKNGKSTLISGLSLYMLGPEGEKGAEVYALAGDRAQANIVFGDAKAMVEMDPVLQRHFRVTKRMIRFERDNCKYEVLSAEVGGKHGMNISCAIFDELHVQPHRELWDTITKGIAARDNPMILSLSTAGVRNTWPHEMYQLCKAIQSGEKELDHYLVRIYEDSSGGDPFDMDRIKAANPSFGQTVGKRYYETQIEETKAQPSGLNSFKRLHLGEWVGAYDAWIPANFVKRVELEGEVDWELMSDFECYMGVDLASSRDTTAVTLVWDTLRKWGHLTWMVLCYVPHDNLTNTGTERQTNYVKWNKEGHLRTTPGNTTDVVQIYDEIVELIKDQKVVGVGYDAWRSDQFIARIQKNMRLKVYPVNMTVKELSRPTALVERMIFNETLCHFENPLVNWQFDNVNIWKDSNNNMKIHKGKSKDKVDIPVSLTIAFAVIETVRQKRKKPSLFVIQSNIFSNKK